MSERQFDEGEVGSEGGDLAGGGGLSSSGSAPRSSASGSARRPWVAAGLCGPDDDPDRVVAELTAAARVRAAAVTAETAALVDAVAALRPLEGRFGVTWRRWVEWQLGLTTAEARRICCLAEKLPRLPMVDAAFRSGELSEGVTEVLARVATPANESDVMTIAAKVATGAQLQQLARDYRKVRDGARAKGRGTPDPLEEPSEASWGWDDDGRFRGRWNLRADDGATLEAALEEALAHLRPSEADIDGHHDADDTDGHDRDQGVGHDGGSPAEPVPPTASSSTADPAGIAEGTLRNGEHMDARRSDALVAMAERVLAGDATDGLVPESTQIIVHHNIGPSGYVDADGVVRFPGLPDLHADPTTVADDPPHGETPHSDLDDRPVATRELDRAMHSLAGATIPGCGRIPDWLAAKLACDSLRISVAMIAGFPVSEATIVRSWHRAQRRALRARDRHCRFPGCTRTRHLHAHHTKPWMLTKRTTVADAVLLCGQHHTLVHLRGYLIELGLDHVTTITRPDGSILRSTSLPPPDPCARPRANPHDPPPDRRATGTGEPLSYYARDVLATSWHLADEHAATTADGPDPPGDDP